MQTTCWGGDEDEEEGHWEREDLIYTAHSVSSVLKQLKTAMGRDEGGSEGEEGRCDTTEDHRKDRRKEERYPTQGQSERPKRMDNWRSHQRQHDSKREGRPPRTDYSWRCRDTSNNWQGSEQGNWRDSSDVRQHRYQDNNSGANWRSRELTRRGQEYEDNHCKFRREESELHGGRREESNWKYQRDRIEVGPNLLVQVLSAKSTFSDSLLQLFEEHQLAPEDVRATVSRHPEIFCMQGEKVQLWPQLDICPTYCGPSGCKNLYTCTNLHICPRLAVGWCDAIKDCMLGHKWHTNHNLGVLRPLFLNNLPYGVLRELLKVRRRCAEGQGHTEPLTVCAAYNQGRCECADCPQLHVCLSFVVGLTQCSQENCGLSHNLMSPSCYRLLRLYGHSTNESPRDLVMALLQANPSLTKARPQQQQQQQKEKSQNDKKCISESTKETQNTAKENVGGKHNRHDRSRNNESSHTDTDTSSQAESKERPSSMREKNSKVKGGKSESGGGAPPAAQRRTLWAHYLLGDVTMPEICYHSVEDVCKLEGSGCPRLHATQHFHWQVRQQPGNWMNLRPSQVICLERGFCDPEQDGVDLPRLDPASLDMSVSGLLMLLGRDIWHAHFPDTASFTAFTLTNSSKTVTLELRRLCTEVLPDATTKPANTMWYFKDAGNRWVEYGKLDTSRETCLVSTITSSDIEKSFLNSAKTIIKFANESFTYFVDCQQMVQVNEVTHTARKIRRRPKSHLPTEETKTKSEKVLSKLPSHWEEMEPGERYKLVTLSPSSAEYQNVRSWMRALPAEVRNISRVQNPFLWQALQNKIQEMRTVYKDKSQVNLHYLFHGTKPEVVEKICSENFDWRLHGSSTGQMYGRGTYFSSDASYSYKYCNSHENKIKFMFVARVAVGSVTQGNSSMVRPPTNPATSLPFDSTVNSVSNPSIIVKYDKQEYYPEYVMSFSPQT